MYDNNDYDRNYTDKDNNSASWNALVNIGKWVIWTQQQVVI